MKNLAIIIDKYFNSVWKESKGIALYDSASDIIAILTRHNLQSLETILETMILENTIFDDEELDNIEIIEYEDQIDIKIDDIVYYLYNTTFIY